MKRAWESASRLEASRLALPASWHSSVAVSSVVLVATPPLRAIGRPAVRAGRHKPRGPFADSGSRTHRPAAPGGYKRRRMKKPVYETGAIPK